MDRTPLTADSFPAFSSFESGFWMKLVLPVASSAEPTTEDVRSSFDVAADSLLDLATRTEVMPTARHTSGDAALASHTDHVNEMVCGTVDVV